MRPKSIANATFLSQAKRKEPKEKTAAAAVKEKIEKEIRL